MTSIRTGASARHALGALVAAVVAVVALSAAGSTRSDAAVASACSPEATRTALTSFVAAFNSGDDRLLDALFAAPPLFGWYSPNVPGLRRTAAAKNRATLIAYFRARHLKGDRLRLLSFTFTGTSSRGAGNFVFKMKRSAADYRGGAWFGLIGKGAAVCSDKPSEQPVQFMVVSVGGPGSDQP